MFDRTVLPESLFVPFEVRPLHNTSVAMDNRSIASDPMLLLRMYSHVVPTPKERRRHVDTSKVLYAERYGSLGRNAQGGGARVGTDFSYQIKGVGRTPLLGCRNVDRAYATGELPLGEAVREHIWGEVLHAALPYGAVRSALVIDTGTYCKPIEPNSHEPKTPRGLLVRQCALRPAHFMRATYFQKAPGLAIPHDRIRVEEAIACLPHVLPMAEGTHTNDGGLESVLHGLAEFSSRLATQHATARARRFMHGAITPSNLCIQGRWLDFDSVSRVPIFASSRHFNPSFWRDEIGIYRTLEALWFYVQKYTQGAESIRPQSLIDLFHRDFTRELRRAFVEISGIPKELFNRLPPEDMRPVLELADVLIQIACTGAMDPLPYEAEDLAGHCIYDIFRIMRVLSTAHQQSVEAELIAELPDASLRERLVSTYSAARDACTMHALALGWPQDALAKIMFLNTVKASKQIPLLEGASLMKRVNETIVPLARDRNIHRSAHALLDDILHDLRVALPDPVPEKATIDSSERRSVHFDGRMDAWIIIEDGKVQATSEWLAPPVDIGHKSGLTSAIDRFQASKSQA